MVCRVDRTQCTRRACSTSESPVPCSRIIHNTLFVLFIKLFNTNRQERSWCVGLLFVSYRGPVSYRLLSELIGHGAVVLVGLLLHVSQVRFLTRTIRILFGCRVLLPTSARCSAGDSIATVRYYLDFLRPRSLYNMITKRKGGLLAVRWFHFYSTSSKQQ